MRAPVVAVQSGEQTFGLPLQPVFPAASNAYSLPSSDPTYTTPPATVGDEYMWSPVLALQRGTQVLGLPLQPITPAASKAYTLSS